MNSTSADSTQWVTVAVLGKTRGNRGELTALPFSSKPERYQELDRVWLFGDGQPYEIETTWFHGPTLIFKFRGIDSITDAEALVGMEVRIPREKRALLDEGEYYQSDLVGCEVVDHQDGRVLGTVTGFDEAAGSGLLLVNGDLMVPFVRAICVSIDVEQKRIAVNLPEGLKDINRP